MVGDEDVRRAGFGPLEPLNGDADAGRLKDQPRPRAGAAVREIAAAIEEARHDRRRAEHDRVNRDGGNEIEDRPPPVIRGGGQVTADNLPLLPRPDAPCAWAADTSNSGCFP